MSEPRRPADEGEGRSRIGEVASSIVDAAGPVLSAARGPLDSLASGARRMISDRPGARVRRVRRMARQPLVNLWELHPEAHRAAIRELGLQVVPVDRIAGTAVEGPAQRGGDFLPLRDRRSGDWRARWQRILNAVDRLTTLPPIELIKFGDDYWVVDGHNRVAAALYSGQVGLDAVVQEMRLPGMPGETPQSLGSVLQGSLDLRDAGAGRFNRASVRPLDVAGAIQPPHEHAKRRRRSAADRPNEPDQAG